MSVASHTGSSVIITDCIKQAIAYMYTTETKKEQIHGRKLLCHYDPVKICPRENKLYHNARTHAHTHTHTCAPRRNMLAEIFGALSTASATAAAPAPKTLLQEMDVPCASNESLLSIMECEWVSSDPYCDSENEETIATEKNSSN